uniref:Transcription elongation regulator 1-like protein n=1 Tax=Castor canadensis TaxID=51338 RepID=A0A8B7W320_CASCN
MQAGARLQRRRRQLQRQQQPRRRQPLLWPMNADPPPPPPPPWVWMVPGSAGLLRLGAGVAPPPVLLASVQPAAAPLLPGLPGWQAPGEPLLPLLPLPSAPDHAAVHHYPPLHGQWLFGSHSPSIGLTPSSTVELVPIFPHVCPSALPLPVGKSWIDKRMPNYKIFLNNSFALDSTWVHPEESGVFHGHEKPHLLANQVALSLTRPAPASRPLPTVVLAPQPVPGGCHNSLKPISNSPTIAIAAAAAAAMVSVDPEGLRGPSPSSMQPCHFLTLTPIKIPLRAAPFSDDAWFRGCCRGCMLTYAVSDGSVLVAGIIRNAQARYLGRKCVFIKIWTRQSWLFSSLQMVVFLTFYLGDLETGIMAAWPPGTGRSCARWFNSLASVSPLKYLGAYGIAYALKVGSACQLLGPDIAKARGHGERGPSFA